LKNTIRNIIFIIVSFTVGFTILYYIFSNYNEAYLAECAIKGIAKEECDFLQKIKVDFWSVNPLWVITALLAFTLSNVSRAMRWNLTLAPQSYIIVLSPFLSPILSIYLFLEWEKWLVLLR
jgi:hypothetical protein